MAEFKIDDMLLEIQESGDQEVQLTVSRAAFQNVSYEELVVLKKPSEQFAAQTTAETDDDVTFTFELPMGTQNFEVTKTFSLIEKLRFAQRLLRLDELSKTDFSTWLAPENVYVTLAQNPLILYRGLQKVLPPRNFDQANLLVQVKALIIVLLAGKQSFDDLYASHVQNVRGNQLVKSLASAPSFQELEKVLSEALQETVNTNVTKYRTVSKLRYRIYQQIAIWGTGIAIAAIGIVGYWQFSVQPFQQNLADANTAFLKKDYTTVAKTLADISEATLPTTQRYELATSYVHNAALSNKQQEAVLNNVGLNSNTDYLNFWIDIGRGQLSKALDTAKSTEDNDLILYAITQQMAKVKNDPNMSGSSREKKLDDLQKSYDTYFKKRTEALDNGAASNVN